MASGGSDAFSAIWRRCSTGGASVNGRRRRTRLSEHPPDHLFECSLIDIKRSGNGGAERDFDGDDDAAVLERIDDPTQASERAGDLLFPSMFEPWQPSEHPPEHEPHIIVAPGRRRVGDDVQRLGLSDVGSSQPHVNLYSHASSSFKAATRGPA